MQGHHLDGGTLSSYYEPQQPYRSNVQPHHNCESFECLEIFDPPYGKLSNHLNNSPRTLMDSLLALRPICDA